MSLLAAVLVLVFSAGDPPAAEAQAYSAYSDPEKTALSFVLSDEGNVREFKTEFGLTDGEVRKVLAAARKENGTLAAEYAQSERVVEANRGLPDERVARKISASDYDEKVQAAIAGTKAVAQEVLPEGRADDLGAWVDGRWNQETQEVQSRSGTFSERASLPGYTCLVFATQYIGYTRYEVALPHRRIKFDGGYRVRISRVNGGRAIAAPVKEVGPWNTYDNYWNASRYRTMWKDLPRCRPEAQAAYFQNYNGGKDEFGREVLNPAGVDLTPAVARDLRLAKYQNAWVYVNYPWVRR